MKISQHAMEFIMKAGLEAEAAELRMRTTQIQNPPPVLNKEDFTQRYKKGEFGNASPTWETLGAFEGDVQWNMKTEQLFHLRNRVPGGPTHYNLTADRVLNLWSCAPNREVWYCSAMAPEDRKILQGEIVLLDPCNEPTHRGKIESGLYLMYNTERLPMRDGMSAQYSKEGYQYRMHLEGPRARLLLRHALCPNSLDWLEILLNRYPGHVVEFSTYEVEWGTVPGFNTIWWEVRKY